MGPRKKRKFPEEFDKENTFLHGVNDFQSKVRRRESIRIRHLKVSYFVFISSFNQIHYHKILFEKRWVFVSLICDLRSCRELEVLAFSGLFVLVETWTLSATTKPNLLWIVKWLCLLTTCRIYIIRVRWFHLEENHREKKKRKLNVNVELEKSRILFSWMRAEPIFDLILKVFLDFKDICRSVWHSSFEWF